MSFNSQEKIRSPIVWMGGKGHMVENLLSLMPPHKYYIEPFGGGASFLFGKKPVDIETFNDLNFDLYNLFSVLRNPNQFKELHRLAELTLMSRHDYQTCRDIYAKCNDPVERAYRWLVAARQNFGGYFGSGWGYAIVGKNSCTSSWNSIVDMLPLIHKRLKLVQIENKDWRKILEVYSKPGYLAYLDPPYVPETRKPNSDYKHELTNQDHKDLINIVLKYPAMIMLSGYENDIYKPLINAGWNAQKFNTYCSVIKVTGKGSKLIDNPRTEIIWRNPAAMAAIENSTGHQLNLMDE